MMAGHRLSAVLALLMLIPSGVCTCGGGATACASHPASASDISGCAPGCCDGGCDPEARHKCPAPLPHQPSCPAVAPADAADRATSDVASVVVGTGSETPADWVDAEATRPLPAEPAPCVPAVPLFLAHCVFLI